MGPHVTFTSETATYRIDDKYPHRVYLVGKATCPVCSQGFNPKRKWHIYCNPKCRKEAWLVKKAGTDLTTE